MNCQKCGTQFRNTGKGYVVEGIIHRNVMCDKERGGCGLDYWYHKPVNETKPYKITETKKEKRQARMHACSNGVKEVTPCTCEGVEPHPNYLNEHRIIPQCDDCGNHKTIRGHDE